MPPPPPLPPLGGTCGTTNPARLRATPPFKLRTNKLLPLLLLLLPLLLMWLLPARLLLLALPLPKRVPIFRTAGSGAVPEPLCPVCAVAANPRGADKPNELNAAGKAARLVVRWAAVDDVDADVSTTAARRNSVPPATSLTACRVASHAGSSSSAKSSCSLSLVPLL